MKKIRVFPLKLNRDNRGFTLLEMIIAVTILAIVVIPLLRSFVISSKANAVAKRRLQANTAAQNLMEDIKACDMTDIVGWFRENQGIELSAVTETEDKKVYTIENLSVNGREFDARITMDGSKDTNYKREDGSGYNDTLMAHLPDMDSEKTAIYVMGAMDDETVAKTYKALHDTYDKNNVRPMSAEDFLKDFNRTIRFSIRYDSDTGTTQVMMYITYECSEGLVAEEDRKVTRTLSVYDNYGTKEPLNSLCLFYTPLYSSTAGDKDRIELENTSNCPVDFYLVKMKGSSSTSGDSGYLDAIYKAGISVTEGLSDGEKSITRICTNLYDAASPKYVLSYSGDVKKLEANITSSENPEEEVRIYSVTVEIYRENSRFDDSSRLMSLEGSRS